MKNAARLIALTFLLGVGCKTNPIERLVDPTPSGARPFPATGGVYMVYDDELKTGGGLGFIPGGQNQSINLFVADSSSLDRQIAYNWNGNDVSSAPAYAQHAFAGFELLVTPDFTGFDSASGKNFSGAGYTKIKYSIRGDLSSDTTLRVEGPDDGPGGATPALKNYTSLSSTWVEDEITIPTADFNNVKAFITVTFQYAQPSGTSEAGGGGSVYFDNIRYEQ